MADTDDFPMWLRERLKRLNLDEEVLGEYIGGILDSDDSNDEEKLETLKDIMEGMMETPDEEACSGIFMKWKECEEDKIKKKKEQDTSKQNTLAAVMEKQALTIKIGNNKSSEKVDVDVKKHVIAQYGEQSDDDICSDSEEELPVNLANKPKAVQKSKGLFQNTNSTSVVEKEKEKREKQKVDSEDKKIKIKQDREKQKEKVEQRKDKEKKRTQKGERRR